MPLPRFDFRPQLVETIRDYDKVRFAKDVGAGLTVAAVALPLAMAFAVASGLKPEAGLITAMIGGFLISALGGSRVQIGGPAGAFIVIVYGIVERYGLANLVRNCHKHKVRLILCGLNHQPLDIARRSGLLQLFAPSDLPANLDNGIAVALGLDAIAASDGVNRRTRL